MKHPQMDVSKHLRGIVGCSSSRGTYLDLRMAFNITVFKLHTLAAGTPET